ncbi:MAG TPA: hypothetical protein VF290_22335 [Pyrinomonadaceae bacterium]
MSEVVEEIFETLLRVSRTKEALLEAVGLGFEVANPIKSPVKTLACWNEHEASSTEFQSSWDA